jgi:DNA polymerase III epsilon subunit-like protein
LKQDNNTNNLSKNKQKQPSNRMYVLVLDTETTGLFPRGGGEHPPQTPSAPHTNNNKTPSAPHTNNNKTLSAPICADKKQQNNPNNNNNTNNLPYAVQISYAIIDTSSPFFPIVEDYDAIIRISDSTPLPAESVAIHGITREISQTKGVPIEHALSILQRSLDTYDVQLVVGHNIAFDLRVINTEYARQGATSAHYAVLQPPPRSSPSSEGASSAPLRPPLCSSPSSSPDPTSTPGEGATSAPLRPPLCPSAQIKNSPGTDSNTLSPSRGFKGDGVPLPDSARRGLRGRLTPTYCTARESVGVCNLRAESMYGGTYLKFGKLGQVFEILFKERDAARGVDMKVFEKYMHNSRVDVLMCARVYVWLCYSVDVFDAWYREMQNYADEEFINVDDSHLVGGGGGDERPLQPHCGRGPSPLRSAQTPQPTICAEGFKGALDAPSPVASPRRSDRLRLKRMRMQEQEQEQEEGATSAHYAVLQPPPCPSAHIKNNPLTSRGFKGGGVPLQEQGSILVM